MAKTVPLSAEDVLVGELDDPTMRARWEGLALARAVAIWLVRFRATRNLTQAELAAQLGIGQSVVARLEAGVNVPKLQTLLRLADVLGLSLHLDITPPSANPEEVSELPEGAGVERITTSGGSSMRVVAA